MRLALIADTFPPLRTSGAIQLRDLANEFAQNGHSLTVILPSAEIKNSWQLETMRNVQILRLRSPKIKDVGYIRRTFREFCMPYWMKWHLRHSPIAREQFDGIIWYSPSIFHAPLVHALKKQNGCKSYLILRDIFPEWSVDLGLMGRGIPYMFFSAVARYQYSVADTIGVQSEGNLKYFTHTKQTSNNPKIEVLHNWLTPNKALPCSIDISSTSLANRKIFVYAGNMGVAQNIHILLDLAERFLLRPDLGFLFVGRGHDAHHLRKLAKEKKLLNTLFYDEIDPNEIPALYSQCHVGMLSLDHRHASHNIPGKFLTYMQNGLPVLATINKGNDLAALIRQHKVGIVEEDGLITNLCSLTLKILTIQEQDPTIAQRCRQLYTQMFMPDKTVKQIISALQ